MLKLKSGVNKLKEPIKLKNLKNEKLDFENKILFNWGLELESCYDLQIKNLMIIHGDESVRKKNEEEGRDKPKNSNGLDCISMKKAESIILKNSSFWCSCDEIISVVGNKLQKSPDKSTIIIENCLFAFPLADDGLHPYGGDHHSYCSNNSATNIIYNKCVFIGSRMRNPQFECNDTDKDERSKINMAVVNSVIYSFSHSGTKLRTADEKDNTNKTTRFRFVVSNNIYVQPDKKLDDIENCIQLDNSFGFFDDSNQLRICAENNYYLGVNNDFNPKKIEDKHIKFAKSGDRDDEKNKKKLLNFDYKDFDLLDKITNLQELDDENVVKIMNEIVESVGVSNSNQSDSDTSEYYKWDKLCKKLIDKRENAPIKKRLSDVKKLLAEYN